MVSFSFVINLTTILSLLLILLAPPTTSHEDYYAISSSRYRSSSSRIRGRLLGASNEPDLVRNNVACQQGNNVCDGVWSQPSNGMVMAHIYCCKNQCRNVLDDKNNCGTCDNVCPFGQACCNGNCTNIAYDTMNCGKCENACGKGSNCAYGTCGYA